MSDSEQPTEQVPEPTATADRKARNAIRAFLREHGAPARAVVERIGRAGARVVLVGADGALGDVIVPDGPEMAHALVDAIDGLRPAEWDTETVSAARIGPAHRRRMAGR